MEEIIDLIVCVVFAVGNTYFMIRMNYNEGKRLCKISAFLWWVCTIAQIVKMVAF